MTPTNWTKYKDSAGNAEYAFGAVPFEMYIKSVKLTHMSDWNFRWQNKSGHVGYGMTRNGYKWSLL